MGQACSAGKKKNISSQNRQKEYAANTSKENTNDHYAQASITAPNHSVHQAENKTNQSENEKAQKNENLKQLGHPEKENEEMNKGNLNSNIEEFSKAKVKQELSVEKEKSEFEKEAEQLYEQPYPQSADNAKDDYNKPQLSKNKDNSFREEEEKNAENLFAKNPEHTQFKGEPNPEAECPICLESFAILQEEPTFTICGHAFCSKCLKGALKIHPYCPLCRAYQSKTLNDAQGQQLYDFDAEIPVEPLAEEQWNVEVVRARLREIPGEEGELNRRVYLSNGEATNIFVGRNAKIEIAPTANLFINGKRVENPQDCNVQ